MWPALTAVVVAASLYVSGVYRHGGAKDIDAVYFYIAAKCWAAGVSPYDVTAYATMFQSVFGKPPDIGFVAYLPTLMLAVLPMAAFDWPVAAFVFSIMNFGAALVVLWSSAKLVRDIVGRPLGLVHWLWLALGSTLGSFAASIFTGQTSVIVAAGCAMALVGCRFNRTWLTVLGLVLASAKPHLSGPLILFIALFEPRQRRAVYLAALLSALMIAYAAIVDPNLATSFMGSVNSYAGFSGNDPARLHGLVSLLRQAGASPESSAVAGAAALLGMMLFLAWNTWRSAQPLHQLPMVIALLLLSAGLARSLQGYDLCIYAVAISLLALLDWRVQVALLLPALVLWRPALFVSMVPRMNPVLLPTLCWLALLIVSIVIVISQRRPRIADAASAMR